MTVSHRAQTQPEAFEPQLWFEQHGNLLYRYALQKVRRADTAEDLVQETLLAAWKGRERFHKQAQVRTWLIAILKRKIIDGIRKSIREKKTSLTEDDSWLDEQFTTKGTWRSKPSEWDSQSPDAELMRSEFHVVLRGCLDKLPTRLRSVFVLWQLDEKSGEEVCQELKISSSNLWVMLHRSRMRLWRCLNVNWYQNPDPSTEKELS